MKEEAGKIIGSGICLFGLIALLIAVAMVCLASQMAKLMYAPAEAFEETVSYGCIGCCNIAAQAISVLLSILIIKKRELPFKLIIKELRPKKQYVKQILKIGTPIAF